jgi:hypothetical protein
VCGLKERTGSPARVGFLRAVGQSAAASSNEEKTTAMKTKSILLAGICFLVLSLAHVARAQNTNVAGAWQLSMPGRDGNMRTENLTLQQDGTKLTGTIKGRRGDEPVTGTINGNDIDFSVAITTPNGNMNLEYKGTVNGDSMSGTMQVMGNSVNWTAKKGAASGADSGGGNGN